MDTRLIDQEAEDFVVLSRPKTPVALALYDHLFLLADPTTSWVGDTPCPGEVCLIWDRTLVGIMPDGSSAGGQWLPPAAVSLVSHLLPAEGGGDCAASWNDEQTDIGPVLSILEEALYWAIEEGL